VATTQLRVDDHRFLIDHVEDTETDGTVGLNYKVFSTSIVSGSPAIVALMSSDRPEVPVSNDQNLWMALGGVR